MIVQERKIAVGEKLKNDELTVSFPGLSLRRVDRFVKLSFRSRDPACDAASKVRFQWLYGGRVTSAVLFDRSFLQLEPSEIPVYRSVRK